MNLTKIQKNNLLTLLETLKNDLRDEFSVHDCHSTTEDGCEACYSLSKSIMNLNSLIELINDDLWEDKLRN